MILRKYRSNDCPEMLKLFYDTVHEINKKDYSSEQLDAWTSGIIFDKWDKSFLSNNTIVAENNGIIAGFGDMDRNGYLDRLYVNKDYQNIGIGSAIINELEKTAVSNGVFCFTTYSSITAKPFFIKHYYRVLKENTVLKNGIEMRNYFMEKYYSERAF